MGFPDDSAGKESACIAGDTGDAGLIPFQEDRLEEENGNPLQYSCLGNPMERGAWQATVQRFTKSDTTEAFCHKEEISPHSKFRASPLNLLQENKG